MQDIGSQERTHLTAMSVCAGIYDGGDGARGALASLTSMEDAGPVRGLSMEM